MAPQPAPVWPRVVGALLISLGATGAVAYLGQEVRSQTQPEPVQSPVTLPVLEPAPRAVVQAARERIVPPNILETADLPAAPWAPGLRLVSVHRAAIARHHRAALEDVETKDTRHYAIGDLLPHGSVLVGVSTATVDLFVADQELVRLHLDGMIESIEDFRPVTPASVIREVPVDVEYVEAASLAVEATQDPDPETVQQAIDALIEAGEPALDFVLAAADSPIPIASVEYGFPSDGERHATPLVQGDLMIAIAETITQQSFGDVFRPGIEPKERAHIAQQWQRWWGLR